MKKWLVWLGILGLVGYGAAEYIMNGNGKLQEVHVEAQGDVVPPHQEKLTITISKDRIYKGDLLLVNKDHPVPTGAGGGESKAVHLSQHRELVQGFRLLDKTIQLSPSLVRKFSDMLAAASQEGIDDFLINSGYRDNKEQGRLYERMGADYAMPAGHSEHNLGLSIDIGSTSGDMNRAPEGKWLRQHAWKYGFILRYPEDKTDITGIRYEPWHFRYVGLPHSALMKEKNMVLEQYLDYLKEQKSITATIDQQTYEITYYAVSKNKTTIQVPANGRYALSGNNMDGVIVTLFPDQGA